MARGDLWEDEPRRCIRSHAGCGGSKTRDACVTCTIGVKAPLEGFVVEQVRGWLAVLVCVEEVGGEGHGGGWAVGL
jgi:hypothetical protein